MHKYGIALYPETSLEDLSTFGVVTVPRDHLTTVPVAFSAPVADQSGQSEPVPTAWASGYIVECADWQQAHTDIINASIAAYNASHPGNPIPPEQEMIWDYGEFFVQHYDVVTDLYRRDCDFMIVPADQYDTNLQDIVSNLGLTPEQDAKLGMHFSWMAEGAPYVPTVREFNEASITTISGWRKVPGITSLFTDGVSDFHVICIKPLVDDLGEREIVYLLGVGQEEPNYTVCRTADRVLHFVEPYPI